MVLTLDLSDEQVLVLKARAAADGLSLEAWIQKLAERPSSERLSAERPAGRKSLARLFTESPFKGLDIEFERESDYGRDVSL